MSNQDWWKSAVFYQIYPRSFQDTTGNGIGDLNGIARRLPYIKSLGIDALWISPFFTSPQKDYGYDVSDYRSIDLLFGSNETFKTLLDQAHDIGIKIIVDLVLSHTSDQHEWFKQSRLSRDNEYSDYYVWSDPKPDGTPPNNWQSVFGGPAWSFDTKRSQYYLHNFLKEQPDLNYHNPAVQSKALDIIKFWLNFGVDGFRFDALNFCFHDAQLRDNPPKTVQSASTQFESLAPYNMQQHTYDKSQPEMLLFLSDIRNLMNLYPNTMTLVEIGDDRGIELSGQYCQPHLMNTAYNFSLMAGTPETLNASLFKNTLEQTGTFQDFWPSWAFCNHDITRVTSRWGGDAYKDHPQFAKMLFALLLCLRGTPFIYQGEELGLTDAVLTFEDIQDPWGKYLWPEWQGRDGCRTPMPWKKDDKNAGFSHTKPWLPVSNGHLSRAVDIQDNDKDSVLNFAREMIALRKDTQALQLGEIIFYDHGEDIVIFERSLNNQTVLCVFNLRAEDKTLSIDTNKDWQDLRCFGVAITATGSSPSVSFNLDRFGFGVFFAGE